MLKSKCFNCEQTKFDKEHSAFVFRIDFASSLGKWLAG
jgi:hypothetical protein